MVESLGSRASGPSMESSMESRSDKESGNESSGSRVLYESSSESCNESSGSRALTGPRVVMWSLDVVPSMALALSLLCGSLYDPSQRVCIVVSCKGQFSVVQPDVDRVEVAGMGQGWTGPTRARIDVTSQGWTNPTRARVTETG
jgi:hypothetical protein